MEIERTNSDPPKPPPAPPPAPGDWKQPLAHLLTNLALLTKGIKTLVSIEIDKELKDNYPKDKSDKPDKSEVPL